jgi:hypothetical protein
MNRLKQNKEILEQALDALEKETGLRAHIVEQNKLRGGKAVDAVIEFDDGLIMVAEIKAWAGQAKVHTLINKTNANLEPRLLVADYINPNMAKVLKENNVRFIDAMGNAYLNMKGKYVYVVGKKGKPQRTPGVSRAFNAMGLKIIYALLTHEGLVNAVYRDIAMEAGVALGTVGWVMKDLKEAGYVYEDSDGRRELDKHKMLITRWVDGYLEKLRPKQKIGEYLVQDECWWEKFDVKEVGGLFGGEIAAGKITGILRPRDVTIYIRKKDATELIRMQKMRLKREFDVVREEQLVILYAPFWKQEHNELDTVNPLIIYADLRGDNNPRAEEAAQVIYEKYFDQYN